ncbi:MAG: OmpA family protein, partial [Alphaproteobacteria bacterium]|nr:OmpA family protein [Alphaproteobacteria bacterium]
YGGRIRVVGYSPTRTPSHGGEGGSVGDAELSAARAEQVAHELIKQGASRDSVITEVAGEGGSPPKGATDNRAEVYFDF